jgi:hypothetical protein
MDYLTSRMSAFISCKPALPRAISFRFSGINLSASGSHASTLLKLK